MNIYIARNGKQTGPFTDEQVRSMLTGGIISTEDLAWRQGAAGWQPIGILMSTPQPPPLPTRKSTGEQPRAKLPTKGPRGVGGWLLFFCVSLTILTPLWGLFEINENWMRAQPAFTRFPAAKTAVIFENWGSVGILLYGFVVGCLIWNGVPYGKRIAQQFLVIRLVAFIILETFTLGLMSDLPRAAIDAGIAAAIPEFSKTLIFCLIWWFYFKRSVRVKNTYGDATSG